MHLACLCYSYPAVFVALVCSRHDQEPNTQGSMHARQDVFHTAREGHQTGWPVLKGYLTQEYNKGHNRGGS